MALSGADLPLLENLVKQLSGPMKAELNSILQKMNTNVQQSSAYWHAKYGDQFRQEFAQFVQKTNASLDQMLQQASQVVQKNAQAISTATGDAL
ncbi:MAG TPA: hypothetical protein VF070_36415 [Streptosporangiaceae bacterium]